MSKFIEFRDLINKQIDHLLNTNEYVFNVNVDKDKLYSAYLNNFTPKDNPIYKERTEHDCQCCRSFINNIGGLVIIDTDYNYQSIWDIKVDPIYQKSINAMAKIVRKYAVKNRYLKTKNEKNLGNKSNNVLNADNSIKTWDHFYYNLPDKYGSNIKDKKLGEYRTNKNTLKSSLELISLDSLNTVEELIEEKSLYRGLEHLVTLQNFKKIKLESLSIEHLNQKDFDSFLWKKSSEIHNLSKIKNTSIGTLLIDISSGMELDKAVQSFEAKVAPSNYKRSNSIVTESMQENARKVVQELGVLESLNRKSASLDELDINNFIYLDGGVKKEVDIFDTISEEISDKVSKNNLIQITLEELLTEVVPGSNNIQIYFENKHESNLMTLIGPSDLKSPNIFKWDNPYSWAYNGDVTDSIQERVQKAGGKIEGYLRASIQWNEELQDSLIDFDLHCIEPDGNLIYFGDRQDKLDVDIQRPNNKVAVENIIYNGRFKKKYGKYQFRINNYSLKPSQRGFSAQIALNNNKDVYDYNYNKALSGKEEVRIADVTLNKDGSYSIEHHIKASSKLIKCWDLNTNKFHKVNVIMPSPNMWSNQKVGNEHVFFILDKCKNAEPTRTLFNEYLNSDLYEHRKTFELLGSKTKVIPDDNQLSGLGFSRTKKDEFICRVNRKTYRVTIK